MIESADKLSKRYVEYLKVKSKPTCLVHGPGHSAYECKVLVDFGSKYSKIMPTKDRGHGTTNRNKFKRQQENNYIVNSAVDEILLQENQKVIDYKGAHDNI